MFPGLFMSDTVAMDCLAIKAYNMAEQQHRFFG